MTDLLKEMSLTDLVDIAAVSLLLWGLLAWARRVGAHLALVGLALLVGLYAVALQLRLQLTIWMFQGFFAGLLVLLAVIFQDDLRRLFEQIAAFGLRRRRRQPGASSAAALYRALTALARQRIGALVVVTGREPPDRFLAGGIALNGRISEELVVSLFDPHSPGHDGAVLVQGDRVARFAVHLPLSANREQLGSVGTRHAAALGIAEHTDALAVVVSEERGTISIARGGRLRQLRAPAELIDELQDQLGLAGRRRGHRDGSGARWSHLLEAVVALVLAMAGWLAFVPGATWEHATHTAEIEVQGLPPGYRLVEVVPRTVEVSVVGPRRRLLLTSSSAFRVAVDASAVAQGQRTLGIDASSVRHYTGLDVVAVRPDKVHLVVEPGAAPPPGPR